METVDNANQQVSLEFHVLKKARYGFSSSNNFKKTERNSTMNNFYVPGNSGGTEVFGTVGEFFEKTQTDDGLRTRLLTDPHNVLSEHGVEIPSGFAINVASNSEDTFHLVLPPDPNSSLSDDSLQSISGGSNCMSSVGTVPSTVSCVSSAGSAG